MRKFGKVEEFRMRTHPLAPKSTRTRLTDEHQICRIYFKSIATPKRVGKPVLHHTNPASVV
jgi:hypothetical protein